MIIACLPPVLQLFKSSLSVELDPIVLSEDMVLFALVSSVGPPFGLEIVWSPELLICFHSVSNLEHPAPTAPVESWRKPRS